MKSLIVFLLAFLVGVGIGHSILYQPLKPINLDSVERVLQEANLLTIEEYATWLQNNTKYQADDINNDIWSPPNVTIARRYGDCEDFAFLNHKVLKHFGFNSSVLLLDLKDSPAGHALCIFYNKNAWALFDNNMLIQTRLQDIDMFVILLYYLYPYNNVYQFK